MRSLQASPLSKISAFRMLPINCFTVICQGCPCKKCIRACLPIWGHADPNEVSAGADRTNKVQDGFFSRKCAVQMLSNVLCLGSVPWFVQKAHIFLSLLCFLRCIQRRLSHTCLGYDPAEPPDTTPVWGHVRQPLWKEQLMGTPIWEKVSGT